MFFASASGGSSTAVAASVGLGTQSGSSLPTLGRGESSAAAAGCLLSSDADIVRENASSRLWQLRREQARLKGGERGKTRTRKQEKKTRSKQHELVRKKPRCQTKRHPKTCCRVSFPKPTKCLYLSTNYINTRLCLAIVAVTKFELPLDFALPSPAKSRQLCGAYSSRNPTKRSCSESVSPAFASSDRRKTASFSSPSSSFFQRSSFSLCLNLPTYRYTFRGHVPTTRREPRGLPR